MKSRRSKALNETVELNITAFLNLMVILVPFLLITAVFSRMTVLELTLPPLNSAENPEQKIDLQLQMVIYPDALEVRDANLGQLKRIATDSDEIDWAPVSKVLLELKQRFPEETAISLLLDREVSYNRLIEVMDHVRSTEIVNVTSLQEVELFPAISIGDAPARAEQNEAPVSLDDLQQGLDSAQEEQP